jgi:Tfp pilus assembly protein PilX
MSLVNRKSLIVNRSAAFQQGSILVFEVVAIFIVSLVLLALLGYASQQLRVIKSTTDRELAFQIAEAGVNYYQWHLAHFPTDYSDGGAGGCNPCGPYVKDFRDTDNNTVLGQYSLTITPPPTGSTVVTIQSTGWTAAQPKIRRTLTVRYGIPSLAKYSLLTNTDVWVGSSESINGEMHANGGIRFDGTGNAPIQSAKSNLPPGPGYQCYTYHGCSSPYQNKPGVWGSASAGTQAFWQMGVPTVDFSSMTADLATLKDLADNPGEGIYLPPSSAQGYSLVFNSNGTVTIYKVTSLSAHATGQDVSGASHSEDLDYNARSLQFTQALPTNGIIYVEDRTWVEGTVAGRVMVAAAKLPYNAGTAPSILIPNNILYTAKDGTVSLGLLAQKDILLTYSIPNNLEIDAALIAQNGSAQLYYFPGVVKNTITTYGSLASFGVWTWSWVNGSGTVIGGYQNTVTVYDGNLLYAPPPKFPLSSSGYQQISWESN